MRDLKKFIKNLSVFCVTIICMFFTNVSIAVNASYDYNGIPDSGGYSGKSNYNVWDDILGDIAYGGAESLFGGSIYDSVDNLMATPGVTILCFFLFVISAIAAFFGYKLYKFEIALAGFAFGQTIVAGVFAMIAYATESDGALVIIMMLVLSFTGGIATAIFAYRNYKIGSFLLGFVSVISVTILIPMIAADVSQSTFLILILFILAIALAAGGGILLVMYDKPIIILFTAVPYGYSAGGMLALVLRHSRMSSIIGILMIIAALYVQTSMNGGLLRNGSFIEWMNKKFGFNIPAIPNLLHRVNIPAIDNNVSAISNSTSGRKCPKCGNEIISGSEFCMECGTKVTREISNKSADVIICPSCSAENPLGSGFCINCGNPLAEPSRSLPSPAEYEESRPSVSPVFSVPQPTVHTESKPIVTSDFSSPEPAVYSERTSSASGLKSSFKTSSSFSAGGAAVNSEVKAASGSLKSSFKSSPVSFSETGNSEVKEETSSKLKGTLKKS